MLCLALTGGIATGKSTFARQFRSLEPLTAFFDCDASVDTLLTTPSVATIISKVLGSNLLDANGALIRSRLREKVFQNPDARKLLEEILHPMVRNLCQQALNAARASNLSPWFLMDVPLLYESGFPIPRDLELVVACGSTTQKTRLMARNGHSSDLADRMLSAQLPIADKMNRADVVIWNGGTPNSLLRQTELFILWLKNFPRP